MQVPFSPPDISEMEIDLVTEVLRSGWITTGPKTKEFEREIAAACGTKRAICLASATAAMEMCLRLLGVGPGDEVITCAYTYTASASVAAHVGARPVFVDCLPGSPHMDAEKLAAAITEKTKAVIPVDLGGVPVDYDAVKAAIASRADLFQPANDMQRALGRIAVIGDCAHAFGSLYKGKNVAQYSDFCCFSFHAVKNLTTAEGGAIAFSAVGGVGADEIYRRISLLSLHGQDKDALAKTKVGAWEYDIKVPGYKCNMTDIMAALGLSQLARLAGMAERRRQMVARYDAHFQGSAVWAMPHIGSDFASCRHLYITQIADIDQDTRNLLIADLGEQGIAANVHFKPLPLMTAYKKMGWQIADFPAAYQFFKKEITLPLHTLLSDEQIDYVAEKLLAAVKARV
jgi:dTDP-4-amino-4,6-dideoxygalactose transaminase